VTKLALFLTWAGIIGGIAGFAIAQVQSPGVAQGCNVVGAAPTYTAGQYVTVTCNTAGQLRMSTTP